MSLIFWTLYIAALNEFEHNLIRFRLTAATHVIEKLTETDKGRLAWQIHHHILELSTKHVVLMSCFTGLSDAHSCRCFETWEGFSAVSLFVSTNVYLVIISSGCSDMTQAALASAYMKMVGWAKTTYLSKRTVWRFKAKNICLQAIKSTLK